VDISIRREEQPKPGNDGENAWHDGANVQVVVKTMKPIIVHVSQRRCVDGLSGDAAWLARLDRFAMVAPVSRKADGVGMKQ
jgi:hypothetical protein